MSYAITSAGEKPTLATPAYFIRGFQSAVKKHRYPRRIRDIWVFPAARVFPAGGLSRQAKCRATRDSGDSAETGAGAGWRWNGRNSGFLQRINGRVNLRLFFFRSGTLFSHPDHAGQNESRRRAEYGERDPRADLFADQRAQQRADDGRNDESEDDGKQGHIGDG